MTRFLDILAVTAVLALAVLIALAAAQPLPAAGHYVLVGVLLIALAVLKLARPARYFRFLMLALAGFVILRYVIWRTGTTLPSLDDPFAFAVGLSLYLAEIYAVAMLAINLFVIVDPITRRDPKWPLDPENVPSVDIFVPSINEDPELVGNTLRAAAQLDYPADKLRIYLLDDGATEAKMNAACTITAERARARRAAMTALCAEIGVNYLTRADNSGAKAGNLNAALGQTSGDLVAVFDADHAPTRDFLRRTVGHFLEDSRLFLVQTPHVFLNADPLERNLRLAGRMPGENEMFYAYVQKGLDRWNASFFCGSAALLRRAALDDAGGFSGVSVTEDCETALDLHARGWTSRYVARPMVSGLNPETFASFIGQRARWLQGMVQIFVRKNPLVKRGLSLTQRLCYLSVQLFWLFPLPRLIFMLAPLAYLIGGLEIYVATFDGFSAYTIPYMIAILTLSDAIYGTVRRPFISDLYETLQSAFLVRALANVVLRPSKPRFTVTAKGDRLDQDHLSPLIWPFIALATALAIGLGAGVLRYLENPSEGPVLVIVGIFVGLNLAMILGALGVCCEHRQRRYFPRLALGVAGTPVTATLLIDGIGRSVEIADVSPTGVGLRLPGAQPETARGTCALRLPVDRRADAVTDQRDVPLDLRACRPTGSGLFLHTAFQPRDELDRRAITQLNYADSAPIADLLAARQRRRSALAGTLFFFWLAVRSLFVALAFALMPGSRKSHPVRAESRRAAGVQFEERLS